MAVLRRRPHLQALLAARPNRRLERRRSAHRVATAGSGTGTQGGVPRTAPGQQPAIDAHHGRRSPLPDQPRRPAACRRPGERRDVVVSGAVRADDRRGARPEPSRRRPMDGRRAATTVPCTRQLPVLGRRIERRARRRLRRPGTRQPPPPGTAGRRFHLDCRADRRGRRCRGGRIHRRRRRRRQQEGGDAGGCARLRRPHGPPAVDVPRRAAAGRAGQ